MLICARCKCEHRPRRLNPIVISHRVIPVNIIIFIIFSFFYLSNGFSIDIHNLIIRISTFWQARQTIFYIIISFLYISLRQCVETCGKRVKDFIENMKKFLLKESQDSSWSFVTQQLLISFARGTN